MIVLAWVGYPTSGSGRVSNPIITAVNYCISHRDYAYAMRELLDPDEQLFGNRIIAAGDGGGADLSKGLMQVWWTL